MSKILSDSRTDCIKNKNLIFRPFRAWRYDPGKVGLDQVLAPPYDVISPAERETLYAKSPYNVVRLILGKESDFYEEAARRWEEWSQKGILIREEGPAFYLYEQAFQHPVDLRPMRRIAVFGVLKLDQPELVLRHEATFKGPKRDRLSLLEKTRTNLSPIFSLYQDSKKRLPGLFRSILQTEPFFRAVDGEGVVHRGWAVRKGEDQRVIEEVVRDGKIFIADGHHRFETAVEYRRRMHEKFPAAPGGAPYDFAMMALVECGDPGLVVLPTHRVIRSFQTCSCKEFAERLRSHFEFLPVPEKEIFSELNRRPPSEKVFGFFAGPEGSFLVRLKDPKSVRSKLAPGKPDIWYDVEANLLNFFIFDRIWGVSPEKRLDLVQYTRWWEEAARTVKEGRAEAAFLMRSPDIDTIRKLADTGERMPQKTTYFYPKLASGLFFYHHG